MKSNLKAKNLNSSNASLKRIEKVESDMNVNKQIAKNKTNFFLKSKLNHMKEKI